MFLKILKTCCVFLVVLSVLFLLPTSALAASGSYEPVSGVTVDVSNADTTSMDANNKITVTRSGRKGIVSYARTATVKITNNSDSQAQISCSIDRTNVNSLTADTGTLTETGFSAKLDAGASATLTLTTAKTNTENKIVLSGFNYQPISDDVSVSITFDSQRGAVSLDGKDVADNDTVSVTNNQLEAVVTPGSDYTFLGWVNTATREVLSFDATATLSIPSSMEIEAVVVNKINDIAYFLTSNCLYHNLGDAITKAGSGGNIVLANNGTLTAGTYTIPAGVTLLIPFDAINTQPMPSSPIYVTSGYTEPTAFRTLTMANGANLVVNGTMNVAATHITASENNSKGGAPTGPVGFVQMNAGSTITVNGTLYTWGFITGSGTVTANSGSLVYEMVQIADFVGGIKTSNMEAEKEVFPFNQYYAQNIEVPLRINYGASFHAFTATNLGNMVYPPVDIEFFSPNGLMRITNTDGYLVKQYDGTTDRLIIDFYGNVEFYSIEVDLMEGVSTIIQAAIIALGLGDMTVIDSSDFLFPFTNNITVNIKSGTTTLVEQNVCFYPGSVFTVAEGANIKLNEGRKVVIYDADQWGDYSCGNKFRPAAYAPSRTYERTDADLVDARILINGTVDASKGYVYTTTGGAEVISTAKGQITTLPGSETITYQTNYTSDGITYVEIGMTPAKLKNEDGSYVETTGATEATTYNHDHYTCVADGDTASDSTIAKCGKWYAGEHTVTSSKKDPTCTEKGYTTHTCTCGHSYKDTYVDETGHTAAEAVEENRVEATATTDGSYDSVVYCSVCGAELSRETITIPATGEPEEVISVTITWGSMNFVYTKGAWNPETHTYTVGSITPEAEGANVITITNGEETNVDLTAMLAYTTADGYTGAVTGSLSATSVSLPVSDKTAKAVTLTLSPNGAHATNATVGKVTVTITKSS